MKPNRQKRLLAQTLLALSSAAAAHADVKMPKLFSDDMILQRDLETRIWGWADAGEKVTVNFAGQTRSATAGAKGTWELQLPALPASAKGQDLVVLGRNALTFHNVLLGDIWVCGGQSNMEWTLGGCRAPDDIKNANFPLIRWIRVPNTAAESPQDDLPANHQARWAVCEPGNAAGISAVGFYFARKLQQETGVPQGVLASNVGGTNIEKWIPQPAFAQEPGLADMTQRLDAEVKAYSAAVGQQIPRLEQWLGDVKAALAANSPIPPRPEFPIHPSMPGSPQGGNWSHLYCGMIHPLTKFGIKGALWYQGESNGGEADSYFLKKRALISSWRHQWAQGDFPFYFVQLANFQKPSQDPAGGDGWAKLRQAQTKTLTINHTGMAVAIDLANADNPDDIHPTNKFDVGERLALWSLAKDYGKKDLVYSGPLYKDMKVEGNAIRLNFDSVGDGLTPAQKTGLAPAAPQPQAKLQRFAIAGADQKWVWADAVIDGATVVVSSPQVPQPVAVRYAFTMNPVEANLYNKNGLPASPFRTDNW